MRKLLAFLLSIALAAPVYAQTKISALPDRATAASTDEFPVIAGGVNYRMDLATALALIDTSAELLALVTNETGTGALVFGTAPAISAPVITGAATMAQVNINGGGAITRLVSGTYTPVATSVANIDSTSTLTGQYQCINAVCTVSGTVTVDPTVATTTTTLRMTVPVASNFAGYREASGTAGIAPSATMTNGVIYADATNDSFILQFTSSGTAAVEWFWTVTYRII